MWTSGRDSTASSGERGRSRPGEKKVDVDRSIRDIHMHSKESSHTPNVLNTTGKVQVNVIKRLVQLIIRGGYVRYD